MHNRWSPGKLSLSCLSAQVAPPQSLILNKQFYGITTNPFAVYYKCRVEAGTYNFNNHNMDLANST